MLSKTSGLMVKSFTAALLLGCAPAAFAQGQQQPAPAQDTAASDGGLADIVVTATRRETNVQDIPIAISAVSGEALRNRGIVDPRQLSGLAPNLNVDQGLSNGQTHVSIRGLASTDFGLGVSSPVAIYIDDIYQPFQYGIGTQAFDLNRIEVLRGPQGTLFGKNTTGGALNYYAQTPTQRDEGYMNFDGGGGDYTHYAVEGAFNKPITEDLAARISFRVDRRNDYVNNLLDGSKQGHYTNYNARLQLAWTPSDATKVNLKLFGLKNRGDGPVYITKSDIVPLASPDSRNTYAEVPTFENYDNYGAVLKIDQSYGDYTLTSISGIQEGHFAMATNDDGLGFDIFHSRQSSKTWQASQELRLATPAKAPLRAVLGLFGQYDHIAAIQGSGATVVDPADAFVVDGPARQNTTTLAAFGSVTYEINDIFSVVGGLRYSYEHKKIDVPFASFSNRLIADPTVVVSNRAFTDDDINYYRLIQNFGATFNPLTDVLESNSDKHTWKRLTWDITANMKPSDDSLFYAKVATGFRSGGYPVGTTGPGAFIRLNPEKVTAYELGFKTEWLDRKLRVNGAAFLMDYKDMQVQTSRTDGRPGLILSNAASSRVKGLEIEVEAAPVHGLLISSSFGYNDAKYRDFVTLLLPDPTPINVRGNNLPFAPRWTGNVTINYEVPVDEAHSLTFNTDWTYRSRIYFDPYQQSLTSDPSRFVGNARIGFGQQDQGWRISAYVNNLTNRDMRAFAFALDIASGLAPSIYAPKRTWGVQAGFKF